MNWTLFFQCLTVSFLLSKNIEEKKEKRYNIHGLSCIGRFPEANRRGGVSTVSLFLQR